MKYFRKYQKGAAMLLLALYAFIAMPAGYWHNHPEAAGKQPACHQSVTAGDLIYFKQVKPGSGDCKICAHQYAAYLDIPHKLFFLTLPGREFSYLLNIPPLLAQAQLAFTNKGPPATV